MNKDIRNFKDDLISFINGYDIPIEIKRIFLADVYALVEDKANQVIAEESANENKELKEESTDAESTQ